MWEGSVYAGGGWAGSFSTSGSTQWDAPHDQSAAGAPRSTPSPSWQQCSAAPRRAHQHPAESNKTVPSPLVPRSPSPRMREPSVTTMIYIGAKKSTGGESK